MTDDKNKLDMELPIDGQTTNDLRGVIGDRDPEDVDLYGYQIIYTTGEFSIERDALLEKIEDVGIDPRRAPDKIKPHNAFTRMFKDHSSALYQKEDETLSYAPTGEEIQIEREKDGDRGKYGQHIHIKIWENGDEESEGSWRDEELGIVKYDTETKGLEFVNRVDQSSDYWMLWDKLMEKAHEEHQRQQDLHHGKDINNMVYYLARVWTDAVKLRDACYFISAEHDGIEQMIDGFRELYQWLNQNANKPAQAQQTELHAIEIVDTDRQAEMVERKVQEQMDAKVSGLFDQIPEDLSGDDTAEEMADELAEQVEELEDFASAHRAALDAELTAKDIIQEKLEELEAQAQEHIENALWEVDILSSDDLEPDLSDGSDDESSEDTEVRA